MYIPKHFAAGDDDVRNLLDNHGAADLVTAAADGLIATFLPFVFDPSVGEHGALLGHLARNNDQWRRPPTGPPEAAALVIVRGPDAYVSPTWYVSKAEHGRVCRPGTTSPPMSTGGWSSMTTRCGWRRSSAG